MFPLQSNISTIFKEKNLNFDLKERNYNRANMYKNTVCFFTRINIIENKKKIPCYFTMIVFNKLCSTTFLLPKEDTFL